MPTRNDIYVDLHVQFNRFTKGWNANDTRHAELDGILWELSEKLTVSPQAALPSYLTFAVDSAALHSVVRELNFQRRSLQLSDPSYDDMADLEGRLKEMLSSENAATIYRAYIVYAAAILRLASAHIKAAQ